MKKYDQNIIFYLKLLNEQGAFNNVSEACYLYKIITGNEISKDALKRQFGNVQLFDIDKDILGAYNRETKKYLSEVKEHFDKIKGIAKESETLEEKDNDNEILNDPMIRTLAIKDEDWATVFGVDLENDSLETIIQKVREKIYDYNFLIKYLGINPGVFEIAEIRMGAWPTTMKLKKDEAYYPKQIINKLFRIKIKKRNVEILFYTIGECRAFLENTLREGGFTPFDLIDTSPSEKQMLNKNQMMVCPGPELHLGKLSTIADFEDYSSKQAMWRLIQVTQGIAEYQNFAKNSTLILGVGNDFFNTDTTFDTTTRGTPQQNDTRYKEIYLWGKIAYIQMIESLKMRFDKTILKWNPGNHDEKTGFSLFENLYDIYNITKDPKVEISSTFTDIRYNTCHVFGDNLIVFYHGKSPDQKNNMSDEQIAQSIQPLFPKQFQQARNVYVFAGHLHQDSEHHSDKIKNIKILRTASLTGIDIYHVANGFLGQRQGHSVYVIDKERGYIGKQMFTITDHERSNKIGSIPRRDNTEVVEAMRKTLNLNERSINLEMQRGRLKELEEWRKRLFAQMDNVRRICFDSKLDEDAKRMEMIEALGLKGQYESREEQMRLIRSLTK